MKTLDATITSAEKFLLKQAIENQKGLIYEDTSSILSMICEDLYYRHHIDARYSGRTVYINGEKAAVIEVSKEGRKMVALYRYRLL